MASLDSRRPIDLTAGGDGKSTYCSGKALANGFKQRWQRLVGRECQTGSLHVDGCKKKGWGEIADLGRLP